MRANIMVNAASFCFGLLGLALWAHYYPGEVSPQAAAFMAAVIAVFAAARIAEAAVDAIEDILKRRFPPRTGLG